MSAMLRSIGSEPEREPPAFRWRHPHEKQLERFMRGELSPAETLPIVRHMLAGCTKCLKVTRPLWELMKKPKGLGGRR